MMFSDESLKKLLEKLLENLKSCFRCRPRSFEKDKIELHDKSWRKHYGLLLDRHRVLKNTAMHLSTNKKNSTTDQTSILNTDPEPEIDADIAFTIAATDLFVERAQDRLTFRAWCFIGIGSLLSAAVILGLAYAAQRILEFNIKEPAKDNPYLFVLRLLQAVSVPGLLLASAYYGASIARACLHEGTALFQRRHALRFGRLYIYMQRQNLEKLSIEDIDKAFDWHGGSETAFRDIKLENMTKTLLHRLADVIPETVSAALAKQSTPLQEPQEKRRISLRRL